MSQPEDPNRPEFPQDAAGQQPYGQAQYGQPSPYGQQGMPGVPVRPAPVVVAAVLGLVLGALGLLTTVVVLIGGASFLQLDEEFSSEFSSDEQAAVTAGIIVFGVLAGIYTLLMIWGSILALTGRSRVLLIVGGSLSIAFTTLLVLGALAEGDPVGVLITLAALAATIAVVVLLSLRRSADFYAAHRFRRTGR